MGDPASGDWGDTWPPACSKRRLLLDGQGLGYDILPAALRARAEREQSRGSHTR